MKKLLTTACLFVVTIVAIVSFIAPLVTGQETKQSDREAMYYRYLELERRRRETAVLMASRLI